MTVKFERWTKGQISNLNKREWYLPPVVCAIYIMQSNSTTTSVQYKDQYLKTRHICRIGAIGVNRLPGAESGNNAAKRLDQVNRNFTTASTLTRSLQPWRYIFGASVKGDTGRCHLPFAAVFAEGLVQFYFSKYFEYLGNSRFYCRDKNLRNQTIDEFFNSLSNAKDLF